MEHTKNITKPQSLSGRYFIAPDSVVKSFNADYLDEVACRTWILKGLHGNNAHCPGCGALILDMKRLQRFWGVQRLRCKECKAFFTALTDTIFSGCHMSLREIYLMLILLSLGVKDKIIADKLNMSQESIRLWRLKFKAMESAKQYE
jgi:transposase-like protein